ncbi:MAG: Clp protease ClpP [Synergistaceae bacterium]|nr:Clp protease ClpP [Synergistaceae bacterium]
MYMTRIRNEAVNESESNSNSQVRDIFIYSSIEHDDLFGMSANKLIDSLGDLKALSKIVLHINSEGGDLFEGVAIYNLLKDSGVEIEAIIEGFCASSASVIAMSASKIIMKRGSVLMIHKPVTFASGTSEELNKCAEVLNMITENIIDIYQARTGLSRDTINDLMNKEAYMSGEMAKSLGFCDEYENTQDANQENKPAKQDENITPENLGDRPVLNFLPVKNKPQDLQEQAINLMAGFINGKRNH